MSLGNPRRRAPRGVAISYGDSFFYFAPDGQVPANTQPFATVVTKDYPGDDRSRLDRPGTFRLNIAVGAETFTVSAAHLGTRTPTTTPVWPIR